MKRLSILLAVFMLPVTTIYPQWTNQNPVPDGNTLWSIFFIDDNTGWMVGSNGFIKKTTNAGLDWVQQMSGISATLKAVEFTDEYNGWIVGESGLILKTTNGGEFWTPVISGTSQDLNTVKFISSSSGFVAGNSGVILKTTDAGITWILQSSGTGHSIFSIYFINTMTGWAACGDPGWPNGSDSTIILKTIDGGVSWFSQSFALQPNEGIYLNSIYFIDENTGWAAGAGGPSFPIFGPAFCIIKTTDGGNTWNIQYNEGYPGLNPKRRLNTFIDTWGLRDIYFIDAENGIAVGGEHEYVRSILITTNGGNNWNLSSFSFEDSDLNAVYITSEGNGWAVGNNGSIFKSDDYGIGWAKQLSGAGPITGEYIYSIFMISENIGYAVGDRNTYQTSGGGVILKTTDAGNIWLTQFFPQAGNPPFTSVFFKDELHGWVSGGDYGGIYKTSDGGINWSFISFPNSKLFFEKELLFDPPPIPSSVFFINELTGFYVDGGIYKTTDGGITWIQKSDIGGSSIYFSDINTGWVVGEGGSIRRSTDSGETWVDKTSGTTANLNCVKFYNSNLGVSVGNGGTVLLSTDGGESWVTKNNGTTSDLKSVTFVNSTSVWTVGIDGTILSTNDLGDNWTTYNSITSNDVNAVSFINENIGWVAGSNGTMFKYSTAPTPLPLWSNQIDIKDAGNTESSGILIFGRHPLATDSIDAAIGEYELPPSPPTGIFDSRFNLPTNPVVSSLKDFRDTSQTKITWTIAFQPGPAGYPMTLSWDSTGFPEGTFYLKDRINGSFVNVNMKNQSGYILTNPLITTLKINYKGKCSLVSVNNRWNMISVPLLAEDMSVTNIFPTAISPAYGYENGYVIEDTLVTGIGYWLKFDGNEEMQVCGSAPGDTVPVKAGWNMIGAYERDILLSQVTTTPPGIIATYFFGFEDGYHIADILKPGKGYWVKVTQDGTINLNSSTLAKSEEQLVKIEQDWGKIKITDNEGKCIILYGAEEEIKSTLFDLPPAPPAGIFDARYSSGKLAEDLNTEKIILISSDKYPITIKAEELSLSIRDGINGEILNRELKNGEEIRITNNKIKSIKVTGRIRAGFPVSYELYQNYPNPFNPGTTLRFSIPKEVQVNLSVYNILGEKIKELKNEVMKPGYFEVGFDASALASGVYLYRIKAGDFILTKKMILMK